MTITRTVREWWHRSPGSPNRRLAGLSAAQLSLPPVVFVCALLVVTVAIPLVAALPKSNTFGFLTLGLVWVLYGVFLIGFLAGGVGLVLLAYRVYGLEGSR